MKKDRIAVIGATGYLGVTICNFLEKHNYEIVRISRSTKGKDWKLFNKDCLKNTDIVINLAGKSLACRWNKQIKEQLTSSRVDTTKEIINWISNYPENERPKTFLCASGTGIYGNQGETLLNENSSHGDDFLANICKKWELAAQEASTLGVRVINMRLGVVLGKNAMAWKKMRLPYLLGVGGKIGNGKSYFSWIHEADLCAGILHCINTDAIKGAVNFSGHAVPHSVVARIIGKVLKRPSLFFVPKSVLLLMLGEFANALLTSVNSESKVLVNNNYTFLYPDLEQALKEIES